MSDVKQAIRNWRNALSGEEALDESVLDELQDHLHAEIDRLPTTGLSTEERVLLAAHRIGAPDALGVQFATDRTASIWARRIYWAVMGWLVFTLPGTVSNLCGVAIMLGLELSGVRGRGGHAAGAAASLALIFCWLILALILSRQIRHSAQKHQDKSDRRSGRPGLVLTGVAVLVCIGWVASNGSILFFFFPYGGFDFQAYAKWSIVNTYVSWVLLPFLLTAFAWHCLRRATG